ncbi:hypothetical protein D3C84_1015200 [compost metagenome]
MGLAGVAKAKAKAKAKAELELLVGKAGISTCTDKKTRCAPARGKLFKHQRDIFGDPDADLGPGDIADHGEAVLVAAADKLVMNRSVLAVALFEKYANIPFLQRLADGVQIIVNMPH